MKKKQILKKENSSSGITLVALVVSIVVLLILSGITLSLVLGDNGIVNKAEEAREKTEEAKEDEKTDLVQIENAMDDLIEEGTFSKSDVSYFPDGFTRVKGTNLQNGLVIEDKDGNQYVWVEVPKTEEVYPTAKLEIKDFNDDEYKKIEDDLHNYTKEFRTDSTISDNFGYYSDVGMNSIDYNNLKKEMLKSVYQNGGFWVGRYEVGDLTTTTNNTARNKKSPATDTPLIKEGLQPYDWIKCNDAQTLAKQLNPDNTKYETSLMYGVQWALILKYFETHGTPASELITDSSFWGNLSKSNFDITSGIYNIPDATMTILDTTWKKVNGTFNKSENKAVLLSTGATKRNSKQNIFDISGNVKEWTLETSSNYNLYPTGRGGDFTSSSPSVNISFRYEPNTTGIAYAIGFRVSLYTK